jgi:hypothetical protein
MNDRAADPLDQAGAMQQRHDEARINAIRAEAAKPIPTATNCLLSSCGEPTANGARWCDSFCRDLWEKEHG